MNGKLALISARTAAITYSFETTGEGFRSWALCTVNDATGELLITSDWGAWSHRWDARPSSLGAPTLTAFIGGRGDIDYLARKLQREGRNGQVFSSEATACALQRRLCERRLNDGRCQLEGRLEPEDLVDGKVPRRLLDRYNEDGLPIGGYDRPFLTRAEARRIWRRLRELADELGEGSRSAALFWERLPGIEGFQEYVTEEPWNYAETVQTSEDRALRDIILPALIEACRDAIAPPAPAEARAG